MKIIVFLLGIVFAQSAQSSTKNFIETIKTSYDSDAIKFEINFSDDFSYKSLKPEYERNFAQFVFHGVGLRSAKIVPVQHPLIEKVFLYQYQPNVVRLRIIRKGLESFPRGIIKVWNAKKNSIVISTEYKTATNSSKESDRSKEVALSEQVVSQATTELEQKILNKIQNTQQTETSSMSNTVVASESRQEAIGVKVDPTRAFLKMILSLFLVVAVFFGLVLLFKKYSDRIDLVKLPFGKKERLIQVIATHRLGKSQAISLVKVIDQYMVMGVTGSSINLITKLGKDIDVGKYIEDRFWGGAFEKHLKNIEKENKISEDTLMPGPALSLPKVAYSKRAYDGPKDLSSGKIINGASDTTSVRASIRQKLTPIRNIGQ